MSQQFVTFKELCPLWNYKLQRPRFYNPSKVKGNSLDIHTFKDCVVGEAYHFSDKYVSRDNCSVCVEYAQRFSTLADEIKSLDINVTEDERMYNEFIYTYEGELQRLQDNFTEHWNTKHINSFGV